MGIPQSKKAKQKEKNLLKKKNEKAREEAAKKESDLNQREAKCSPGNLHNGDKVNAVDSQHTGVEPTEDIEKTHAAAPTEAEFDTRESDISRLLLDESGEEFNPKRSKFSVEERRKSTPVRRLNRTAEPEHGLANGDETERHFKYEKLQETKPKAKENTEERGDTARCDTPWDNCKTFGLKEPPGRPASKMQAVRRATDVIRGVIKENLLRKEPKTRTKKTKAATDNRHLCWAKSEKSRTNNAKTRLREKLAKKAGQDAQEDPQNESLIAATEEQKYIIKADPAKTPVLETVSRAVKDQETAAVGEFCATLEAQQEVKVSPPQDTAVRPKEKYTLKDLYQTARKKKAGNAICEAPWVATARLAACLALRQTQGGREGLQ